MREFLVHEFSLEPTSFIIVFFEKLDLLNPKILGELDNEAYWEDLKNDFLAKVALGSFNSFKDKLGFQITNLNEWVERMKEKKLEEIFGFSSKLLFKKICAKVAQINKEDPDFWKNAKEIAKQKETNRRKAIKA